MNTEFFDAINDIEAEKGIPRQFMYDKIRQAMLAAFRNRHIRSAKKQRSEILYPFLSKRKNSDASLHRPPRM